MNPAPGGDEDWDSAPAQPVLLNVRCTDADCANDLHCFKQTRAMGRRNAPAGTCRSCDEQLVDLDRTRRRGDTDRDYLLASLRQELIRHHFWHLPFDQKALDHATRKGRNGLRAAAEKRIRASVGKAEPFRDGTQTPMTGNTLFYAQHATASCCRTCVEYWHGIAKGRELTDEEVDYLHDLIVGYIDARLPDLADEPVRVPRTVRR